ncbi:ATP-binding cassette sub-family G member 5 [Cloeon dipterum]|uniref:ATP-binding cassette sub-family G member 5 n=1 Tax=Cloeon dipterum TaxID=197152 RepID=UPI00321FF504
MRKMSARHQPSVLELCNIFHTGQVESGGCLKRLSGRVRSGLVLKDVSFVVHSGELLAVLGSKGSGKRALLDVISGRAEGATRGQVLLNGTPLDASDFQKCGAYVGKRNDLLTGLTTEQTLLYAAALELGSKVSNYVRRARVKQVLADLALTHVAYRGVDSLDNSEYRRLVIGVQIIKDPILLLLDEPTAGLSPLHAYLVLSMLANHARNCGRIVILSMERPRSDVFPFLDRVAILCLGDVVYAGRTTLLLDYFQQIGFPCSELENPLMYYLCLSTVDRRSRDLFMDSTQQIASLVEKFKIQGSAYSHDIAGVPLSPERGHKLPLCVLGRPGALKKFWALFCRQTATTFNLRLSGLRSLFLQLFLLPIVCASTMQSLSTLLDYQRSYSSVSGLCFIILAISYYSASLVTSLLYPELRTRFYQEKRDGLCSGSQVVISSTLLGLPLSAASAALSAGLIIWLTGNHYDNWLVLFGAILATVLAVEQQTKAILIYLQDSLTAFLCTSLIFAMALILSSGTLRAQGGMPGWLQFLTTVAQPHYTSTALHQALLADSIAAPHNATLACPVFNSPECRFKDGMDFYTERLGPDIGYSQAVAFLFPLAGFIFNLILYSLPLPEYIKQKQRE